MVPLQDNETAAGTCPLCRAPLTPQGLFPRSALLPPGFKEQETAAKRELTALEADLQRFLKVGLMTFASSQLGSSCIRCLVMRKLAWLFSNE
jgi:hypothetical protein